MSLFDYEDKFKQLNPNLNGGHPSPHKVCLLLAIMDLVESHTVTENKFKFDRDLRERFSIHFANYRQGNDQNNAYQPFFHLHSQGFWHHKVSQAHQQEYEAMVATQKARGPNIIARVIDYAYLDDELFEYMRSPRGRELLKSALAENLRSGVRDAILDAGSGWSWDECDQIVRDYFEMLKAEVRGEEYVKAEHNRELQNTLGRSRGSIERKHMNISAVLNEMGALSIDGYKPLSNYQREILPDVVGAHLARNGDLCTSIAKPNVEQINLGLELVDVPQRIEPSNQVRLERPVYAARKVNYLERHQSNIDIGSLGEKYVLDFEKERLNGLGKAALADRIEQVSDQSDALGFDIKSYEENGKDRLIEVKATTTTSRYAPFFVSKGELKKSQSHADSYYLYRVYSLSRKPKVFIRAGALDASFELEAKNFTAKV